MEKKKGRKKNAKHPSLLCISLPTERRRRKGKNYKGGRYQLEKRKEEGGKKRFRNRLSISRNGVVKKGSGQMNEKGGRKGKEWHTKFPYHHSK